MRLGTSSWDASARFDGFICAPEWAVYRVKMGIPGRAKCGEEVEAEEDLEGSKMPGKLVVLE